MAGFDVVAEAADGRAALTKSPRVPPAGRSGRQLPDVDGFAVAREPLQGPAPPTVVLGPTRDASDYGRHIHTSGAAGLITKSRLSGETLRAVLRGASGGTTT